MDEASFLDHLHAFWRHADSAGRAAVGASTAAPAPPVVRPGDPFPSDMLHCRSLDLWGLYRAALAAGGRAALAGDGPAWAAVLARTRNATAGPRSPQATGGDVETLYAKYLAPYEAAFPGDSGGDGVRAL